MDLLELMKTRRIELQGEIEKATAELNKLQAQAGELNALAQRLAGAIAIIDEMLQKQQG